MLRVLNILKQADIQVIASTISDTVEYGIYRIICSDPTKAHTLLKENGLSITISDVFAIELDNTPGEAANTFALFSNRDINISYMYSFTLGGKGILIFRTSDTEKAREVISLNHLHFVSEDRLKEIL